MGKISIFIGLLYLFLDVVFLVLHVGGRSFTILSWLSPDLVPHSHKECFSPRIMLHVFWLKHSVPLDRANRHLFPQQKVLSSQDPGTGLGVRGAQESQVPSHPGAPGAALPP